MSYEAEVAWQINDFCDFDCVYCWLHYHDKTKAFVGITDTEKVINGFNNNGLTWLIHMSGGEPFFFPNFVKLCQELTKKHYISINTNLSHRDVTYFAESINPEKVKFIHTSLHITEREKLGKIVDFIKKFKILKERGFQVFASYLMYPRLINRFERDYAYFKSIGIILRPKVFWGRCYRGIFKMDFLRELDVLRIRRFLRKIYPDDYSKKEKNIIMQYIEKSAKEDSYCENQNTEKKTIDLSSDKKWVNKLPSFKGKLCLAGKDFVKMDQDGKTFRCNDETHHYLGNMFNGKIELLKEPTRCAADICSCPYVGFRYALQLEKNSHL